jgi:tRNA (cmo5U34)-methyltransferase
MPDQADKKAAKSERMDWTVWQEADVVAKFARDRRSGILGGAEQLEVLCQLLPPRPLDLQQAFVLDLGCGDGILLETALRQWPGAQGVALDGSPAMLERAAERLSIFHPAAVTFIHADFNAADWTRHLPRDRFHAVVSGFAIHHSEDERKRSLYTEIYGLLEPGGVFVNIEHVASPGRHGEELFERAYALNLMRSRRVEGQSVLFEDVLNEITNRLDASANRLTPVETQLAWLREIGFQDVDCYWKYYELAVLAGYRPQD